MAVYTNITLEELSVFLKDYDLGTPINFEGIAQGVSNSNFFVFTDKGRYVLTLFEERRVNEYDLPFFFAYSEYLSQKGFRVPRALSDKKGNIIGRMAGKAASIINFLSGRDIHTKDLSPAHCFSFGDTLARMHKASEGFLQTRENSMGLSRWKMLAEKIGSRADLFEPDLEAFISKEILDLEILWPKMGDPGLPFGTIHADMFPDNIFFEKDKVSGIIDFYFSCTDFYAYDLALSINSWCFISTHEFSVQRFNSLMKAYHSVRALSSEEKMLVPVFCRGAALRILLSRLEEYLEHDPRSTLMIPHDPREYLRKLRFHKAQDIMRYV